MNKWRLQTKSNDQDVLCVLGEITLSDSPIIASFKRVARYIKPRQGATPGRPMPVLSV